LRATVHRDAGREVRVQRRLRTRDVREAWQHSFESAIAFANRMRAESPGYRERLERDGFCSPVVAKSWNNLPVLTKNDLRHATDSWYGALVRREDVTWTYTSGSTGEPFKFPLSKASQTAESAAQELNLLAVGWNPAMRRATIKVEPKAPQGLRKLYRVLAGKREIGFAAADFRMQHVPAMVGRIREERISYLRGYSTSIYLFAQEVLRCGLTCAIPLITTLGEGLSRKQAEVVERAFGGRVYRDYGGSEAMHIGFECMERNGYHVDLARFYIEILRDGRPAVPGESGDIIVTAFRNAAMPLVRYHIGDVGSWAVNDAPCPCGNRFPLMAEVLGRSADVVVTATGHVINVPLLVVVFEYAQEHIAQFKVIQKGSDSFDVLWVARHDGAADPHTCVAPAATGDVRWWSVLRLAPGCRDSAGQIG
jgi:phenylacetate-CoA ligase